MKTWLEIQRTSGVERRSVKPDGMTGVVEGKCPGCGSNPFRIAGGSLRRQDDRTYMANGRCVACGDAVGYVYHRPSTIFGLEEDERVLFGRARVY